MHLEGPGRVFLSDGFAFRLRIHRLPCLNELVKSVDDS
jgi:hypothetical protein